MELIRFWIGKIIREYKRNEVAQKFSKLLSLDILIKASNAFLVPVYARLMPERDFGFYGYCFLFISAVATILNFGLYASHVKLYYSIPEERRDELNFQNQFILCIGLILVMAFIYGLGIDFIFVKYLFKTEIPYHQFRFWVALAILVTVQSFMQTCYFITIGDIKKMQIYNILKLILIHPLVVAGLWYFPSEDSVNFRLAATYVLEGLIAAAFLIKQMKDWKISFDSSLLYRNLIISFPMLVNAIISMIASFSDKMILEKSIPFEKMAIYTLGVTLSGIISQVFASLLAVILPNFMQEKDVLLNIAHTGRTMKRSLVVIFALSVGIIAGTQVAIWLGIFRESYQQVVYILPFLTIYHLFANLSQLYTRYPLFFEKTWLTVIAYTIVGLITLGCNMLLIPKFQVYGAGISLVISSAIGFWIHYKLAWYLCNRYANTSEPNLNPSI